MLQRKTALPCLGQLPGWQKSYFRKWCKLVLHITNHIRRIIMTDKIVHDAEYYVVEVQNKEKWAARLGLYLHGQRPRRDS